MRRRDELDKIVSGPDGERCSRCGYKPDEPLELEKPSFSLPQGPSEDRQSVIYRCRECGHDVGFNTAVLWEWERPRPPRVELV